MWCYAPLNQLDHRTGSQAKYCRYGKCCSYYAYYENSIRQLHAYVSLKYPELKQKIYGIFIEDLPNITTFDEQVNRLHFYLTEAQPELKKRLHQLFLDAMKQQIQVRVN